MFFRAASARGSNTRFDIFWIRLERRRPGRLTFWTRIPSFIGNFRSKLVYLLRVTGAIHWCEHEPGQIFGSGGGTRILDKPMGKKKTGRIFQRHLKYYITCEISNYFKTLYLVHTFQIYWAGPIFGGILGGSIHNFVLKRHTEEASSYDLWTTIIYYLNYYYYFFFLWIYCLSYVIYYVLSN